MSVEINGYLFYTLGYNPTLLYLSCNSKNKLSIISCKTHKTFYIFTGQNCDGKKKATVGPLFSAQYLKYDATWLVNYTTINIRKK